MIPHVSMQGPRLFVSDKIADVSATQMFPLCTEYAHIFERTLLLN